MKKAEAWQTAEMAGPTKALPIAKPEVVSAMIKRAKRPVMVVGHEAAELDVGEAKAIDYAIRIAKAGNVPIIATAHTVKEFLDRGYEPIANMPAVDIGNRLRDSEWRGLDGEGQYDLAVFMGIPYYMEWTILSGLKHFALNLRTITLDRLYQPHASWSYPNLPLKEWGEQLDAIEKSLKGV